MDNNEVIAYLAKKLVEAEVELKTTKENMEYYCERWMESVKERDKLKAELADEKVKADV